MSGNESTALSSGALQLVVSTHELQVRPSRPPDYQMENEALLALAQHMADSPQKTLQKLVEVAQVMCRADSAGVSIVSEESDTFCWPAIAGTWKSYIGGGTPRHFGPSGVVLDCNSVQLFSRPERCYPYLVPLQPPVEEALVTPFYVAGKAIGTVWVVAHDPNRKFDAEDVRLIENLGRFAAAIYPLTAALDALVKQDRLTRDVNESLVVSSVRLHELTERAQGVAEVLQSIFLPGALPHNDKVRFDATYSAAEKDTLIGGDWLEAAQLPDGRYLISVGDVTGHGLNASIIAGRLRQAITDFAFVNDSPAVVLANANRMLRFQHPDVYATALVGFLDPDCTRLTYACGGHPPPLLATSPTVPAKELPRGGVLLGYADELDCPSQTIEIFPGSVLAFYTDGITEFARDMDAAEAALKAAVAQVVGDTATARPAVAVQNKVLGDATPADDIALLIVQFNAVDTAALRRGPTDYTKTLRFNSSDASAARTCRRELMNFIGNFAADQDALFTAELILGEILANTVQHAPGPVEVNIDWRHKKPVFQIVDTGPGFNSQDPEGPQDIMNEHGRGLHLIKRLADDVSIASLNGSGTELRAVLPVIRNTIPTTPAPFFLL